MSDGEANVCLDGRKNGTSGCDAASEAIDISKRAGQMGVIIFSVGFGKDAGASTLISIKNNGAPGSEYFEGVNVSNLEKIYANIGTMIGSALISNDKVYGKRSMLLKASKYPPSTTSDKFNIKAGASQNLSIYFYRKLKLSQGKLDVIIFFYDESRNPLTAGNSTTAGSFFSPLSDAAYTLSSFNFTVPGGAKMASIMFNFSGAGPLDSLNVDDVYLGPPITCTKTGTGWSCGDISIEKTSDDGEMYPYLSKGSVGPGGTFTLKDANCQGFCRYKIISPGNMVNVINECS
jgi:hypothetical protein